MTTPVLQLRIDKIKADPRAQLRERMREQHILHCLEGFEDGTELEVTVFRNGEIYWLADGFHSLAAAKRAGRGFINARIHEGDLRDAILWAAGANSEHHALPREPADIVKALTTLLFDGEWQKWSNREIARHVHCRQERVAEVRDLVSKELSASGKHMPTERTVKRKGKTYTMKLPKVKPLKVFRNMSPDEQMAAAKAAETVWLECPACDYRIQCPTCNKEAEK